MAVAEVGGTERDKRDDAWGDGPGPRVRTGTPWAAIVVLGLGIFIMTTMEQLPIGVLTLVAEGLGASNALVGLGVSVPGILAACMAVVAPKLVGRVDRRVVLAMALITVLISGIATSVARTEWFYLASRTLVGLALGVFWSLLGATVTRMAAPGDRPKALTVAFSGSAAAVVLGVPLATWLGETFGWRQAFSAVGVAAGAVGVVVLMLLPRTPVSRAVAFADIARAWSNRGVRFGVLFTFLLVTAHFTAYTYASPLLQDLGGVPVSGISAALLAFGVAGLAGNFLAGPLLRRSVSAAVVVLPAGVLAALVVFRLFVESPASAFVVMIGWGLFAGAISVVSQAWVLGAAGELAEPASGLNSGAFNFGIAAGALVGGQVEQGALLGVPTSAVLGGGSSAVLAAGAAGVACALALAAWGSASRRGSSG
ncbi:MFS transporter [Corynebacterium sp.]|uniref:MFS transporter n=1 Tax=Corynebacterium sp. TaxID=1720 RepID=UPI0026DD2860|nr:MFS transporter [Corynebacterium sp.]MDO4610036.1 MFS transporter [Corynebacterium sp.]